MYIEVFYKWRNADCEAVECCLLTLWYGKLHMYVKGSLLTVNYTNCKIHVTEMI